MKQNDTTTPGAMTQASAALDAADFETAVSVLAGVEGRYDATPEAQLLLVRALTGLGRLAEAGDQLRGACLAYPKDARLQASLGNTYARQGAIGEAIECFERAMALAPADPAPFREAALSALQLRRFAKAKNYAEEAVGRFPDNPETRITLARVLVQAGQWKQAIGHLRHALEVAPRDVPATLLLSQCLMNTGQKKEAEAALGELDTETMTIELWRSVMEAKSVLLERKGQPAMAAALLRDCIDRDPGHRIFYQRLMRLELMLGQKPQAEEAAEAFCRLGIGADRLAPALDLIDDEAPCDPELEEKIRVSHQLLAPPGHRFADWRRRVLWADRATEILRLWWYAFPARGDEIDALIERPCRLDLLHSALKRGKGVILVGSHLGPFPAATRAMETSGLTFRTIGRPNFPRRNPDPDLQIVIGKNSFSPLREAMQVLRAGGILGLTADLVTDLSGYDAVTVEVLGRDVQISSLAARAAYRDGAPSLWMQAYWRGRSSIEVELGGLPEPKPAETRDQFIRRWVDAYGAHLESVLKSGPENIGPNRAFGSRLLSGIVDGQIKTTGDSAKA